MLIISMKMSHICTKMLIICTENVTNINCIYVREFFLKSIKNEKKCFCNSSKLCRAINCLHHVRKMFD